MGAENYLKMYACVEWPPYYSFNLGRKEIHLCSQKEVGSLLPIWVDVKVDSKCATFKGIPPEWGSFSFSDYR